MPIGVYERTPKHNANISAALRGRPKSPETCAKLSAALAGRTLSPEHCAKLRVARATRIGQAVTPETRAKLSAASTKHGMHRSVEYQAWLGMRQRCSNPNDARYADYGGRGITVCARWSVFANFFSDMGERSDGLSLDRIDNEGNYEPGNCRWATRSEQQLNKRRNGELKGRDG